MISLKIYLQQSHIDFKISSTKIYVYTSQAKLVNALCHLYEGTRPNSHVICARTYTIKLFSIFRFLCGFGFLLTRNKSNKVWSKQKQKNAYKEMYDAQMHDNKASNAWRVLQRSKELDQGPEEQKLNHRRPSSSKRNDCLEWVSQEKWDKGWKNENQRCT